ncbi:hypothetical protein F5Y16DRAFT_293811 [Xylariaceae sp. FL0255]|nr:hypothetical protein F5Y16DRAFT_293811 [Xylariaceae sp. FL0255]
MSSSSNINFHQDEEDGFVQIRVQDATKPTPMDANVERNTICFQRGGLKRALRISFKRTIRVPDNETDTYDLPPDLGTFPLYKVEDYQNNLSKDVIEKGGLIICMYQREAMWINFEAAVPFAIKIHIGGINAISGLPMDEDEATKMKLREQLQKRESLQDYMVVPGQKWLDGIVSYDGKIRQFVAQPKGSGYSVEAQTTGQDAMGGIQIEVTPLKFDFPKYIQARYQAANGRVIQRHLTLANLGIGPEGTWKDMKQALHTEFGIHEDQQTLSAPHIHDASFADDNQLGDFYFKKNFILTVSHKNGGHITSQVDRLAISAATMALSGAGTEVDQMTVAPGGLIRQTIRPDPHPAKAWDGDATIMFHVHILDPNSFSGLTGKPAPPTPISMNTYAEHDSPFFDIWGEEPTGIHGLFNHLKSSAQMDRERDAGTYAAEKTVPVRVIALRPFQSTFMPVAERTEKVRLSQPGQPERGARRQASRQP